MDSGIPRFRRSPFYPIGFDPRKLNADQSPVPSQYSPTPWPFDPSKHPDLKSAPPNILELCQVRATFDSRLPRSFDFWWNDLFLQGVSQSNGYQCPPGYVIIIRKMIINIFPAELADEATPHDYTLDKYGHSVDILDNIPKLQIIVDGANSPFFTFTGNYPATVGGIPLYDFYTTEFVIPCFILINQNQNFSIQIPLITDNDTVNVTVEYYGNYIYATGRNLPNEIGNPDPAIVEEIR